MRDKRVSLYRCFLDLSSHDSAIQCAFSLPIRWMPEPFRTHFRMCSSRNRKDWDIPGALPLRSCCVPRWIPPDNDGPHWSVPWDFYHSFRLRCCVNLFFKAKAFNQCLVRIVSVMDDHRPASDGAAICPQRLSGAWLSHAAKIQHASLSVRRRAYAELISRQSTEQPAVFGGGFRLPSGEVCLVDPRLSGKDYVWLDVVDHKKDLGKPVKPRSYPMSLT